MRKHIPYASINLEDGLLDLLRESVRRKYPADVAEIAINGTSFPNQERTTDVDEQSTSLHKIIEPGNPQRDEIHYSIRRILSAKEGERDARMRLQRLTHGFIEAAELGLGKKLQSYIDEGFPVNYQDSRTGKTALHAAASCQARSAVRVLLRSGECDHLLRDKKGRLASEVAYLIGRDPAVARLLGIKERKQGEAQGIQVTRRPRPE